MATKRPEVAPKKPSGDGIEKRVVKEIKRGAYVIRHEIWTMPDCPPTPMKVAYSPEGHYIGVTRWAFRLVKKYGVTQFFLRTNTSNVCSIGYSPKRKKWYGWSHRAIYGYRTRRQAERFAASVA